VDELFGDRYWVSPGRLAAEAAPAGLRTVAKSGPAIGYFARLEP
jgi:hypothetical protein